MPNPVSCHKISSNWGVTLPLNVVNLENMNAIKGIVATRFNLTGVIFLLNVMNMENTNAIKEILFQDFNKLGIPFQLKVLNQKIIL